MMSGSDSDSNDGFASLITNGEQAFWRSYETNTNSKPAASEDSKDLEVKAKVGTSSKKLSKNKKLPHKSRKRLICSSSSEDSSGSDTTTSSSQQKKTKIEEKADDLPQEATSSKNARILKEASSDDEDSTSPPTRKPSNPTAASTNSLFSTIMKTLSNLPDIPPSPPPPPPPKRPAIAPPSETHLGNLIIKQERNPGLIAPSTITTEPLGLRRSTRNKQQAKAAPSEQLVPDPAPTPTPEYVRTNLDISIDNVVSNFTENTEDPSKTPPYKQPSNTELNKIIEVRVLWKSIYLHIFKIRRFTPLKKIIEHYAAKENINPKYLCFSMNDKMVNLNLHSAVTLRYKPHEEIEAGIIECDDLQNKLVEKKEERGVRLKVRLERSAEIIVLEENIKLEHLYAQVAMKFGLSFGRFKLEFDGRIIGCYDTIRDLGMGQDNCVDILL